MERYIEREREREREGRRESEATAEREKQRIRITRVSERMSIARLFKWLVHGYLGSDIRSNPTSIMRRVPSIHMAR